MISRIDQLLGELKTELPRIADEIALSALGMIKNRIIDQKEGIPGKQYSTREMLATKDQFVVKSAFKQSVEEVTRYYRRKGKITTYKGDLKKVKKVKLWIKFPGAKIAVPVMRLERGYREFREIQGRPGDHVNLSLTGKMWQGTTIVGRIAKDYTYITIIGGANEETREKLSANTQKFGLFLTVNDEEQAVLQDVFNNRIQAIYDRIILK